MVAVVSADAESPTPPAAEPADAASVEGTAPASRRVVSVHVHHGPFHTHCENCGTRLEGPWCHHCGQHDFEFHRSFWHVFMEALETIFHFEGKFFRNVVTLLFQPGRLTADFNAGKRAAQMPPFRLYIFVSFVFFLLLIIGSDPNQTPVKLDPGDRIGFARDGWPAAEIQRQAEERQKQKLAEREAERAKQPAAANEADKDFSATLEAKAREALKPEGQHKMVHAFFAALPKMLLFCLPFFALYTWVLFRKSGLVYLQHLVVAVHFHTFIYLWVLFRDGWGFVFRELLGATPARLVFLACNFWMLLYPVLMLRRLFAASWPWAIFKTWLLGLAYGVTLAIAFLATAVILFVLL